MFGWKFWVPLLMLASWSASASAEDRTRMFELQPQVGFSYINLTGFSQGKFVDAARQDLQPSLSDGEIPVEGTGPSAGIGAQLKAWVFVLGARYNFSHTSDFDMHTVVGDLGLRLGDDVALYGRAGGGLVYLSSLPAGLDTNGFVVSGSGGLDFKLGAAASLGFGLDVDVLLLTQAEKLRDAANQQLQLDQIDRDTVGFHVRPQVHLTWHI
jgi:hypothetical protein